MKTIAICNHKGGVGKTALSMAIAEGLHRKGKRTLLVDLDQQMNATQQAKIDTTDEVTVYDLLTSFDYTAKDGIKHFDGGDIIPGDVLVSNAESDMAKLDTRLTMLADAMEGIDDDYDYAIIDCPPSLGLVTRNAMVAADELIVPVIPNRSSLKGFTNIQKCVNSVRRNKRLNPNLRIAGIVVNMFDGRTSLSRGVVNELPSIARAANTKMFHTIIRKCEAELMEENEKRRNVELAYLSLMLSGKKVSECELASEVLKISRAKGEKSLAMLVQSSIKITVKVLSLLRQRRSCPMETMVSRLDLMLSKVASSETSAVFNGILKSWQSSKRSHCMPSEIRFCRYRG